MTAEEKKQLTMREDGKSLCAGRGGEHAETNH